MPGQKGEDGIGADVAQQFLREINQAKNQTLDAKNAAEIAKSVSEDFAKEAKNFKEEADDLAIKALQSAENAGALHSKVKDMFCRTEPTDQMCIAPRGKREISNPSVKNGAGRPTSFISQVINFFYPAVGQDKYKAKNKIQELNQVAKIIDAADIVTKFEEVLGRTALKYGIAKKSLNFDPLELQSTIINKSLSNDENRNELLKLLCSTAREACSHHRQIKDFLVKFRDGMGKRLINNEQQRDFINTEKIVADNEQPGSYMSDITPPSSLNTINQTTTGYLR